MFRTVPLSIIRSFFTVHTHTHNNGICHTGFLTACEQDQDKVPSWSSSQAVNKFVWHIPLLCVKWKTPDDGQRNCPKHVDFYSKNKFDKLVYLVGFIISKKSSMSFHSTLNNPLFQTFVYRRQQSTQLSMEVFNGAKGFELLNRSVVTAPNTWKRFSPARL